MLSINWSAPLLALQAGVILIAVVLWLEARGDARRRQRVLNIAQILRDGDRDLSEEAALKRAA